MRGRFNKLCEIGAQSFRRKLLNIGKMIVLRGLQRKMKSYTFVSRKWIDDFIKFKRDRLFFLSDGVKVSGAITI